jgi:hypothetical protein
MIMSFSWLGAVAVAAGLASAPSRPDDAVARRAAGVPPRAADSNYQRLAFWVGDWEVVDSACAHYATQRVRAVADACAITAEWTGRAGDKGMNLSWQVGFRAEHRFQRGAEP